MLYSEKDIKITFRQMMVYLCVAVVVAAAGIVAGLLLGFSDHLSTGTIVAILCIAGAVFLFGNFLLPATAIINTSMRCCLAERMYERGLFKRSAKNLSTKTTRIITTK